MDSFFEEKPTFAQRVKKHQVGIYVTIIVHLLIVIGLLLQQIGTVQREKMAIMFDYSREFEKEKEEKLLKQKEDLKAEVDELFKQARAGKVVRNVAVNTEDLRTSTLKDDKGINQSVYDDAKNLQDKLDATRDKIKEMQESKNEVPVYKKSGSSSAKRESYKGPSVLEFTLTGRTRISLPVPVYKCPGAGKVCVQVEVNRDGYVVGTSIVASSSTSDDCLYESARRAAKLSRFSPSESAPAKQTGTIVYLFVAQ